MALAPDPADKLDAKADGGFQPKGTRFDSLDSLLDFMSRGGVPSSYEAERVAAAFRQVIGGVSAIRR